MSSTKTFQKLPSISSTSTSSTSGKESLGSSAATKQKDSKKITDQDIDRLIREAEEKNAKMSPEKRIKNYPWMKYFEKATPTTADQVPDLWDEI